MDLQNPRERPYRLPIFFNSTGGSLAQSYAIGRLLRERKMMASVGATIPEDCRTGNAMDASCRAIVRSMPALKAQLRLTGAICHSACVYALIGGSVRQIPEGALLGVHAPIRPSSRAATDDQFHAARRRYAVQMGVDPELVELADKTPHVNLRILTRDEIVRFQIETQRR